MLIRATFTLLHKMQKPNEIHKCKINSMHQLHPRRYKQQRTHISLHNILCRTILSLKQIISSINSLLKLVSRPTQLFCNNSHFTWTPKSHLQDKQSNPIWYSYMAFTNQLKIKTLCRNINKQAEKHKGQSENYHRSWWVL